jgi:hypothetical protein
LPPFTETNQLAVLPLIDFYSPDEDPMLAREIYSDLPAPG